MRDCTRRVVSRRTGRVSELVLLPFYPVLQGLGIAPCDLNLLLDRLLVHVGHATLLLPVEEGGVAAGARASESGDAGKGKSRGPRRERSSPGHADGRGGSRRIEAAMAAGARGAAAIACAGK